MAIAGLIVISMALIALFFNIQPTPAQQEGKTKPAGSGYFVGTMVAGVLLDRFGFRMPLYWIAGYAAVMMVVISFSVSNKPAADHSQVK